MVWVDGLRVPFRKKQDEVNDAKKRAQQNLNSAEYAYYMSDLAIKAVELKQEELVKTLTAANDAATNRINDLELQLKNAGSDLRALEGADKENANLRKDNSRLVAELATLKAKHKEELDAEQSRLINENERDNEVRLKMAWQLLYPDVDFAVYKLRYEYATAVYDAEVLGDPAPPRFKVWAAEQGAEVSDDEEPEEEEGEQGNKDVQHEEAADPEGVPLTVQVQPEQPTE